MATRGCILAALLHPGCGMQMLTSDIPAGDVPLTIEKVARAASYTPEVPGQEDTQRVAQTTSAAPDAKETLQPGVACACMPSACFNSYDRDGDGCLSSAECALQAPLGATNCTSSEWDQDGDGCVNLTVEWPHVFDLYNGAICPIQPVAMEVQACQAGYYLESQGTCSQCNGGATRRRRSFSCDSCPTGTFDAGDFDDCLCGLYTASEHQNGTTTVRVSTPEGLRVDDMITISAMDADCVDESAGCNNTHWESVFITAINGNELSIGSPLKKSYSKFSNVRLQCTTTDGSELSRRYRTSMCGWQVQTCGCGSAACNEKTKCDMTNPSSPNGRCVALEPYPYHATPAPTVGAKGDPHLVNIQGEHFDINHGGAFTLLRFPQVQNKTAELSVDAIITPEYGRPCVTYITQVELSGIWFNDQRVQVRCYLQGHEATNSSRGQTATFLGIRVLGAGDEEVPWTPIKDFDDERHLGAIGDMEVRVIKSQWAPRKHKKTGPDVGGQFQFNVRNKKNKEGAKIIVRQDLPTQEHLNVAVRRLSTLGRVDVGGLLGFDEHPESLERVTAQCNQWRSANHYEIRAMPDMESRSASMPRWKQKWQQVREERRQKAAAEEAGYPSSDATKDNEAGASLHARDVKDDRDDEFSTMEEKYAEAGLMCACPADPTEYSDGVLTEAMTALFADATWD